MNPMPSNSHAADDTIGPVHHNRPARDAQKRLRNDGWQFAPLLNAPIPPALPAWPDEAR